MQLTKSLLKEDFGLKIELPDDRLCPPVPNRHNYILWLKSLLDSSSYRQPGGKLCGLDIGTGASCIYPLLGTAQRPWCFIATGLPSPSSSRAPDCDGTSNNATDIDEKSLVYAQNNVELNGLESRIRIVQRSPTDALIPLDDLGIQTIDFVMMNPPFYSSDAEMVETAERKARPPNSACTGAPVEMVCDGGEVAHVGRMLQESLLLRERVQWYTSMVGKATSLEQLVEELRKNGIDNYAVAEFLQGKQTRRWALGWSFGAMRPDESACRGVTTSAWGKFLPSVVRVNLLQLPGTAEVGPVITRINEVVGSLELMSWVWETQALRGIGRARENVWGRSWRRRKQREMAGVGTDAVQPAARDAAASEECKLGFSVFVQVGTAGTSVTARWLEGHDMVLFESFGAFLKVKLKDLSG